MRSTRLLFSTLPTLLALFALLPLGRVPEGAHAEPVDSDGDGFNDSTELFVGTNPGLACGPSAWPVDNDDDGLAGLADVLRYIPAFNTQAGDPNYNARYDLDADGTAGLPDVLRFIPFFGVKCDRVPPAFAGLTSAWTCIPGPIGGGRSFSYNLSWDPATDNVTPSKKIVYDVYQAETPGGEDFSKPTFTTPAGATTFATPPLPSDKSFYFVVRARDQAGNSDSNKVEREGQNLCE